MAKNTAKTSARGYGGRHQRERARLAPLVAAGSASCAKCGGRIFPGEPWDLGHTDDRTAWTGPEHASCNRRAAAIKRNKGGVSKVGRRPSRQW